MELLDRIQARLALDAPTLVEHRGGRACVWSGSELERRIARYEALFREAGAQRVGLCAPSSAELAAAFLAVLRSGGAVVPFHAGTPVLELEERVARFGVDLVLGPGPTVEAGLVPIIARPSRPALGSSPALLLQTSGTTGEPRAVVISRQALSRHTLALVDEVLGLGPADRVLVGLPLAHSFGCRMGLLAPLAAGAVVHLVPRFSAHETLALLSSERITWAPVVPTMLSAWVALEGAVPPALSWVLSAGAPLPKALNERAAVRLGCEIREGYGLTEASFATVDRGPAVPGTVGLPVPGVELRLVHGEVQVRGSNLMDGYLDDPVATAEAFTADGWLRTGDVGALGPDGRLRIVDRIKDIILRGGQTIYPAEVEHTLAMHPGVAAVAVFGVPDVHLGERVAAAVVPRSPNPGLESELRAYAQRHLAAFKIPVVWSIVDSLPQGASGKVQKRALRAMLAP